MCMYAQRWDVQTWLYHLEKLAYGKFCTPTALSSESEALPMIKFWTVQVKPSALVSAWRTKYQQIWPILEKILLHSLAINWLGQIKARFQIITPGLMTLGLNNRSEPRRWKHLHETDLPFFPWRLACAHFLANVGLDHRSPDRHGDSFHVWWQGHGGPLIVKLGCYVLVWRRHCVNRMLLQNTGCKMLIGQHLPCIRYPCHSTHYPIPMRSIKWEPRSTCYTTILLSPHIWAVCPGRQEVRVPAWREHQETLEKAWSPAAPHWTQHDRLAATATSPEKSVWGGFFGTGTGSINQVDHILTCLIHLQRHAFSKEMQYVLEKIQRSTQLLQGCSGDQQRCMALDHRSPDDSSASC